ncbi:MAG: hypothetical protein JWP18_1619 [Solirubrobacterales bacterium]|jgi:hypothetical protein|nr:hypothetical protein [Solirubrobacterales bacterium]
MDDAKDKTPQSDAKHDDRRTEVNPADDPRPMNPPVDEEAQRKGQEVFDRVKPY